MDSLPPHRMKALAGEYGTLTHDAIESGSDVEFVYQAALMASYYGRLWLEWAGKQTERP